MVWYILIGLMVLAGIWLFVIFVPKSKWPLRKWTEFAFYSLFLFAYLCKAYWQHRTRARLWKWLVAVLAVHLCLYIPVLAHIGVMPAILYVVIMPIEAMLIALVFKLALNIMWNPNAQL
jgi:hypothetical protein